MKTKTKEQKAMTKFQTTDEDLPSIFMESELRGINPMAVAKSRIHSAAFGLGIEVSPDQLEKFAVLLIALEEE